MTFDLDKILQSKREFRKRAASWPIVKKLAMLDALRERALAIRTMTISPETSLLREEPPASQAQEKKSD
jgi:hypothetical protein